MLTFLRNSYLRIEHSEYKAAILVCAAVFFIAVRVVFEIFHSSIFLTDKNLLLLVAVQSCIWLSLWYSSCFVMGLVWFRYIAKAPLGRALYIVLAAVGLWVPIVNVGLVGAQIHFTFLSYSDPTLLASVLSLMYLSPINHYMFNEFWVMAIGILVVAYRFSGSIIRSLVTTLCIYLSLIFVQAFIYICSEALCVFVVKSSIFNPIFICFYFAVLLCVWLCVLLFPELRAYAHAPTSIFTKAHATGAFLFLILCTLVNFLISSYFFDLLFLLLVEGIFFYVYLFLATHWKEKKLGGLNLFLAMYGLLIAGAFICLLVMSSTIS